ncbi:hypothetical protein [Nonomuraea sp. NPDC049624]
MSDEKSCEGHVVKCGTCSGSGKVMGFKCNVCEGVGSVLLK